MTAPTATSGKCLYLEQKLLDLVLGRTPWTPPAVVYLALSTSTFVATMTGAALPGSEVLTGAGTTGYNRVSVTNDGTNWPLADSQGQKLNLLNLAFPTVLTSWSTVRSVYIVDGNAYSGSDNCLYGSNLPPTLINPGPGPVFASGNLILKET